MVFTDHFFRMLGRVGGSWEKLGEVVEVLPPSREALLPTTMQSLEARMQEGEGGEGGEVEEEEGVSLPSSMATHLASSLGEVGEEEEEGGELLTSVIHHPP